jgi:hypothetical protein
MSFLELLNLKKSKNRKARFRIAINSFSGSAMESYHSQMTLNLLKQKGVDLTEIVDINQELVFEKEKSKKML